MVITTKEFKSVSNSLIHVASLEDIDDW